MKPLATIRRAVREFLVADAPPDLEQVEQELDRENPPSPLFLVVATLLFWLFLLGVTLL